MKICENDHTLSQKGRREKIRTQICLEKSALLHFLELKWESTHRVEQKLHRKKLARGIRTPRKQNQPPQGKKNTPWTTRFWETKKKGGLSKQKKSQRRVPLYCYSVFRANLTEILHECRHKKLRNAGCMTQETAVRTFWKECDQEVSGWFVRFF